MKRIKTPGCCSLGIERLENHVRIREEGVEFENFDATPYVYAWASAKMRRPNQRKEKQNYEKSISTSNKNNILDSSTSGESESEDFGEEDFDGEINILLNKKPIK